MYGKALAIIIKLLVVLVAVLVQKESWDRGTVDKLLNDAYREARGLEHEGWD